MIIALIVFGYLVMTGVVFKIIGDNTRNPNEPWETPGPFFGGLVWPVFIAVTIGSSIVDMFSPVSKAKKLDTKRKREIEDAKHKVALARINAEETRILERALDNDRRVS